MNGAWLKGFDVFCFDLDGTVWQGGEPLPGAVKLLGHLRRHGKRLVFITNNSMDSGRVLARRLSAMGIPTAANNVVTAGEITGDVIREELGHQTALVLGSPALRRAVARAGHQVIRPGSLETPSCSCVVVGLDPTLSYRSLTVACHALYRGTALVAVNLDSSMPGPGGLPLPKPGAVVAALTCVVPRQPLLIGKPAPHLFRRALARFSIPVTRIAMVGDNPHTDVAGALAVGMTPVLLGAAASQGASQAEWHFSSAADWLAAMDG